MTPFGCRTITHKRIPMLPSSTIFFIMSMVASGDPASSKVVIPFDNDSCAASSRTLRRCASASAPVRLG